MVSILERIHLLELDVVDSTNRLAYDLGFSGAKPWTIVHALEQTSGRGRRQNDWLSPRGNLFLSAILKPINGPKRWSELSFVISLAVADTVAEVADRSIIGLKWPNDVLIDNKKVCGILIESAINGDNSEFVVGIGINYSLPQKESWWGEIGGLTDILPREKLINSILKGIINYLENGYQNWQDAWEKRCVHMSIELEAVSNNQKDTEIGIFNGIDEEGKMLLQTTKELKVISSGECSIKGIY